MNIKKTLYGVILATTITATIPSQAMFMPEVGVNLWSLQTLLNFITNMGLDSKDFLIDQSKKHPYITKGLAGYLALCYARALLNKYKVTDKVTDKIEKGYNTVSTNLNRWEFLYGGLANIWRIPQDWIRTPLKKASKASPTGLNYFLWGITGVPTYMTINKFLKSDYFKSSMFSELVVDGSSKSIMLATLTGIASTILKYGLEYAITGNDSKINELELYRDIHEKKEEKTSLFKKADVSDHVFFGKLSELAETFAWAIKNNIKTAKKTFLYSGKPGNGKSTNAIEIAIQAGADEIYITDSSKLGDRYIAGQSENFKDYAEKLEALAIKYPNRRFAWIIEEVDQLSLQRTQEDSVGKDSSKTTNAFLTIIEDLKKKYNNIFIISSTNLLGDMDAAGFRRIADVHEEMSIPTPEQREELLIRYRNEYKANIHDSVIEHIFTFTEAFPTYALKEIIKTLATLEKQKSASIITLENYANEIDDAIFSELKKVVLTCEGAKKNISRLKTINTNTVEHSLAEINKDLNALENNKVKLAERVFSNGLLSNLACLKEAIVNDLDKKEIIKIQTTCLNNLNEHYEQLPKTSEQIYLEEQLKKLDEAKDESDITNVANAFDKYFDSKTVSKGSLQKQINNLEAVLKELETLEQNVLKGNKFYIEKSCTKIKELIKDLQDNSTFAVINQTKQELKDIVDLHQNIEAELSNTNDRIKSEKEKQEQSKQKIQFKLNQQQQELTKTEEQYKTEANNLEQAKTQLTQITDKFKKSNKVKSIARQQIETAEIEIINIEKNLKTVNQKIAGYRININNYNNRIKELSSENQNVQTLKTQKIQQEADLKVFKQAQDDLNMLLGEEEQKLHFKDTLQYIETLSVPSKYYYDTVEKLKNGNTIKENLNKVLESKKLQKKRLKEQSQNIITNIINNNSLDGNEKQKSLEAAIKILKDGTRTSERRKYKNIIYKLETDPTEEVINETIETIKKASGINNIIIKKDVKQEQKIVKDRNELEVELRAQQLAKNIGTSLEETKVLINLINKDTDNINEVDINQIYTKEYAPQQKYNFIIPYLFSFGFSSQKSDDNRKNVYMNLALKKIATDKNIKFDSKKLLAFSSKANTMYEALVTNGGIAEDDFNCLLYLQHLKDEKYKNYQEIIEKELNLNNAKTIIKDMSQDINFKKENNNGKTIFTLDDNDITDNIKLLSYIHKIPKSNEYFEKNNSKHFEY